jgi:hypothetical protein
MLLGGSLCVIAVDSYGTAISFMQRGRNSNVHKGIQIEEMPEFHEIDF